LKNEEVISSGERKLKYSMYTREKIRDKAKLLG